MNKIRKSEFPLYHLLLPYSDLYEVDEILTLFVLDVETLRGPAGVFDPGLILRVPVPEPCPTDKAPDTVRLTCQRK